MRLKADAKNEKMITQTRIISEYGWTKSLINRFLPDPVLRPNPHYRGAKPMKVWKEETVKCVMKTPEFQSAMQKTIKRKESANKAVDTKHKNMMNKISSFINSISIQVLPEEELKDLTLKAKQEWYDQFPHYSEDDIYHEYPMPNNAYDADKKTVNRWIVNYIRHKLVNYDSFLGDIDGKVGSVEAYPEVKVAVLEKIAATYPQYKEECERQIFFVDFNTAI